MILVYKWGLVKKYAYGQALLLLIFAVLLFIHAEFGRNDTTLIWACGIYGCWFALMELYQMGLNRLSYFTDFWNILDFARLIILFYYIADCIRYLNTHIIPDDPATFTDEMKADLKH